MINREDAGDVAIVRLAYGKVSALDAEFCTALVNVLGEIAAGPAKALIITGTGSAFSAGVDLFKVLNGGAEYLGRFLPSMEAFFRALLTFPKPAVAAVNGHAIAGGCILACAADRRLMARGTGRIGVPELLVGVPFPPVPLEIVRFTAAPTHLSELLFGGVTLTGDAAMSHGLVDAVVEPAAVVDSAVTAAESMAALPAAAFALTKQQLRGAARDRMREGRQQYDRAVQDVWAAPATLAAIRAYIERTFKKK